MRNAAIHTPAPQGPSDTPIDQSSIVNEDSLRDQLFIAICGTPYEAVDIGTEDRFIAIRVAQEAPLCVFSINPVAFFGDTVRKTPPMIV